MTALQAAQGYAKIDAAHRAVIEGIAAQTLAMPEIHSVWLYGSYANGTARPDSDIDMAFFLCETEICGLQTYKKIARLCAKMGLDVQAQVMTADELDAPCGIVEEIVENGFNLLCVAPALKAAVTGEAEK